VSIKGSDYRWFQPDLPLVKATAAELPSVSLGDALSIALLVIDHQPHNAERAAVRWLGRFCLERREVTLAQVREALDAFAALVTGFSLAERPRCCPTRPHLA
jgi:hypothetical protein